MGKGREKRRRKLRKIAKKVDAPKSQAPKPKKILQLPSVALAPSGNK